MKPTQRILLVILVAAAVFGALYPMIPYRIGGDGQETGIRLLRDGGEVFLYYERSRWVPEGLLPYRDVFIEYPQFAAAYLAWPRVLVGSFLSYDHLLVVGNLLLLGATILVTARLLTVLGRSLHLLWLLVLPASLYFALYRFDIVPALIVQCALWLLLTRRWTWALVLIVVAGFFKWYPLLLLPLLWHWMRQQGVSQERAARQFFVVGAGSALLLILFLVLFREAFFDPYHVHLLGRGFEQGTVYAILFGVSTTSPTLGIRVLHLVLLILQGAFALSWIVAGGALRKMLQRVEQRIGWMALIVISFALFAKFYSPQWQLWFLPLVVLLPLPRWAIGMLVLHDLSSFAQFPVLFDSVGKNDLWYQVVTLIRTGSLVAIGIAVWRCIARPMTHVSTRNFSTR